MQGLPEVLSPVGKEKSFEKRENGRDEKDGRAIQEALRLCEENQSKYVIQFTVGMRFHVDKWLRVLLYIIER